MPKNKNSRTQHKAVRNRIKRVGAAGCVLAALLCTLVYFRSDLLLLSLSLEPHRTPHDMPLGSIIIPYDNNLCRLRVIDNATGGTRDVGIVDCLGAAEQNTAAWKALADQQKATEIRKSFRNQ